MTRLIPLRETEPVFLPGGRGTRRFNEYIRNLTDQVNDTVEEVETNSRLELLASIADLNERLGSGDILTSDSDSFTVDSTELFVDLTEA